MLVVVSVNAVVLCAETEAANMAGRKDESFIMELESEMESL